MAIFARHEYWFSEGTEPPTMSEQSDLPVASPNLERRTLRQNFGSVLASLALVLAVAFVDYMTSLEISVSLLYLAPIFWSAWRAGRAAGVFVAVASAVAWLGADLFERGFVVRPWIPIWNMLMIAGIFTIVAILVAALKRAQESLEATVQQRTARLREANAELQRTQMQLVEAAKMETVGRMAAGVAHEVKNPLTTLNLGADYFFQRKPANADEAAMLQDMKDAVRRASDIINQMLDFSRPRPLKLVSEDLNTVVENSLSLMKHQLLKLHINVVRQLQPDLPRLPLDRTHMEHVLVNLFTNAAQAMCDGGTLTVRTRWQPVSGASDDTASCVTLDVEDTGQGIPAQHLSKVFEPFFTTKAPGQGTGLGLAIVRQIVQIHGGSVTLGNRPEGGVRVTLKLNLKLEDQPCSRDESSS